MKKSKSTLIRLIVCVAALAVLVPVGIVTKLFTFDDFKKIDFHGGAVWNQMRLTFPA